MIDSDHPRLSIAHQCDLVRIARSSYYYTGTGEKPLNLELMRVIDTQFMETPWYGSHRMARHLRRKDYGVGRKRVRRLMRKMGLTARTVLSWRLSNTMDADFCVEALEEALARYGQPEIFNTDQGTQFTTFEFTRVLKEAGVRISMDGRDRWMDNVFIERLWRSLKYECVYLRDFHLGSQAQEEIGTWMTYYNEARPHSALGDRTPAEAYHGQLAA